MRLCEHCEVRNAPWEIKGVAMCVRCYFELMRDGKVPPLDELGSKKYIQPIKSMQGDGKRKEQAPKRKGGDTRMKDVHEESALAGLGSDLTKLARGKKLDPVIGREVEIDRMIRVLCRRTKNNPLIIGEPGVGKTAVIEGLAIRIANGDVPKELQKKTIYQLDIGSVIAGTKFRGEFEERIKRIVNELKRKKNVILFVDEMHTMIGAGGAEGAVDASNLLKPALSRGEIQLIGATTHDEYVQRIEKDQAFERRFQRIDVGEPSVEETIEIINGVKEKYETYHSVKLPDEIIETCVKLAEKYISDRKLPDKAFDVLDEVCAFKRVQKTTEPTALKTLRSEQERLREEFRREVLEEQFEEVQKLVLEELEIARVLTEEEKKYDEQVKSERNITLNDVYETISDMTGIPIGSVTTDERTHLAKLEERLTVSVKGQEKAIKSIARSVRRNLLGVREEGSPAGVFLFLGPTGVGKTELAKALAKDIYGSEDNMVRFNMNEFMEKHTVSRLIGSPPGYVGFGDGGELTNALRRKPYSLVLFDEVEKAHPDVFHIMLQLFDEGKLTDSRGREVDAKQCIFILTSNLGSGLYKKSFTGLGFSSGDVETTNERLEEGVLDAVKNAFPPEFVNRLQQMIVFQPLTDDDMKEIARKFMDQLVRQLSENDMIVTYHERVIMELAKKGYNPAWGAREMKREISVIRDLIADEMVSDENRKRFNIDVKKEEFIIKK